jgi:hypothetical protein
MIVRRAMKNDSIVAGISIYIIYILDFSKKKQQKIYSESKRIFVIIYFELNLLNKYTKNKYIFRWRRHRHGPERPLARVLQGVGRQRAVFLEGVCQVI